MTARDSNDEQAEFDVDRLRDLLASHCDECLTDADAAELSAILTGSSAARSMYVRYMNVHAGLDWQVTSGESVAELVPSVSESATGARRRANWKTSAWALPAIAAMLLLALGVAVWSRGGRDLHDQPQIVELAEMPEQIATVTELGPGAQWAVTPRADAAPTELRERDVVCVTDGEIQVTFDSGAVVTLYAPAMMEVISPMKGRAIRGRLAANVVERAQGFTIETPQATVVDLGTVFGVEVGDEGATDVVVFKGAVDLHFDSGNTGQEQAVPKRLTSGEAMRIDKGGTQSRIVSISSDRFTSPDGGAASTVERPILISTVTDNIDRDQQSWNYYEIVHGGMREDAKAFVDRVAHEWNGRDARGMPKFLVGGDYVKTFNNDKYCRDLELFVTIDHPCRLYILIDDRVKPPEWLREQFHDTGAELGLDVGPFNRVEDGVLVDDRLPGVGPGVAVDDVVSIWERDIDEPQVVHLGANEADHRYINMYGIVAVPRDAE